MIRIKSCPFCGSEVIARKGIIGGLVMFTCTNINTCGAVVSFNNPYVASGKEPEISFFNKRVQIEYVPQKKKKGRKIL